MKRIFIFFLLTSVAFGESLHEYLRVNKLAITSFRNTPKLDIPTITERRSADSDIDISVAQNSVFQVFVYSKEAGGATLSRGRGTAFAIEVNHEPALFTCHHLVKRCIDNQEEFIILFIGQNGKIFHANELLGASLEQDLLCLKVSTRLENFLTLDTSRLKALDTLITCGDIGNFSHVYRKGEFLSHKDHFFLSSLPATQGSSGSPVLNEKGYLVGVISEVVPVLRESGLYSGDHFAEFVMTKCVFLR